MKYAFKPKYDVRDKKSLLKLLKNYDLYGTGGILQEDIEESLPNAAKALKVTQPGFVSQSLPQCFYFIYLFIYSPSNQCSTTCLTKAVGWCI